MEIRPFLYVNQIAECGSMTKAAAALFITQPALSNYISKLEEELGVRLFDRSVTPLRLTYAGERYLAYTRRILMQVGDLEREMRDISRNQRGRIRLGFPGERMICMLPVLLPAFQEKYPEIRIETENGSAEQLVRALREGDVDFVFLPMWEKHRGISHQKIAEEELILVARKGYLPEDALTNPEKRIFNRERLGDFPLLTLHRGHALRSRIDLLMKELGIQPDIFLESHSNMLSCRLAAQGSGVALVPEISLRMLAEDGKTEWYHLGETPVTWDVNILWREDAYLGEAEKDLIAMAEALFGGNAAP